MPISGYFDTIFASAGDVTTVPDGVQSNGSVSYSQGWGPFYAQDPLIDPATALFIDRAQTNQMFNDVTAAIQYIQQNGCAPFITTAMNGGSAYSYRKGVTVSYDAGSGTVNWISTVAANTSIPGADANWIELPSNVSSIYTGGTTSGSANAQTVTTTQGGFSNNAGDVITFKTGFSNSAAATLNPDTFGNIPLKKANSTGLIALTAFDLVVGVEYMAISDGTNLVMVNPTNGGYRQKLGQDTTFYVATTGNDSTGIGTAGLPWATIQHAWNYIAANIDIAGFNCIVQVVDGTYSTGLAATIPTVGGVITLQGNTATPTNVVLSTGSSSSLAVFSGCLLNLAGGFKLISSSYMLLARGTGASIAVTGAMNYGAGGGSLIGQINAFWGAFIEITHDYTISGGSGSHFFCAQATIRLQSITVTLSGTPTYIDAFAACQSAGACELFPVTWTGAGSGQLYKVTINGVVNTNGGGLPSGLSGNTTNTGGEYV